MNKDYNYCLKFFLFCFFLFNSHLMHSQPQFLISNFKYWESFKKADSYYKNKDYENSYKAFKKLFNSAPELAAYYLGEQLYNGLGVKTNVEQALFYYEWGAMINDSWCQERLCSHYFGEGEEIKDKDKSFYWSHKASLNLSGIEYGSAKTTYVLAYCYLNGIGTPKNELKGEIWMTVSAILEYPKAESYFKKNYLVLPSNDATNDDFRYILYHHLDSILIPVLVQDNTVAAQVVECLSYLREQDLSQFYTIARQLYLNEKLSPKGKYSICSLLLDYYKDYKYDLYNAEIMEQEMKNTDCNDREMKTWFIEQYIVCIGKHFE